MEPRGCSCHTPSLRSPSSPAFPANQQLRAKGRRHADNNEETRDDELNVAIVRGTCSSPAEVRMLPSEQRAGAAPADDAGRRRGDVGAGLGARSRRRGSSDLDAGDEVLVVGRGPAPVLPGPGRNRVAGRDRGRGGLPGPRPAASGRGCGAGSRSCSRRSTRDVRKPSQELAYRQARSAQSATVQ